MRLKKGTPLTTILCLQRGRASPGTQDTPRESRSKMGLPFHMILSRPTIILQVLLTGT